RDDERCSGCSFCPMKTPQLVIPSAHNESFRLHHLCNAPSFDQHRSYPRRGNYCGESIGGRSVRYAALELSPRRMVHGSSGDSTTSGGDHSRRRIAFLTSRWAAAHIEQSTLSRRILELEGQLGIKLFDCNHQMVELTEAGSKFVEEAREAELHIERAVTSAKAVSRGTDEVLNFVKSSNTNPYLVSMILATHLP